MLWNRILFRSFCFAGRIAGQTLCFSNIQRIADSIYGALDDYRSRRFYIIENPARRILSYQEVKILKDEEWMQQCLQLAQRGVGKVSPNPMVGAVIVKGGKLIGQGFHEYYGGLHAERNALQNCTEAPEGSTLYVNLEPCCHYGKQPPCVEAIMEAKIARVVVGCTDPNPKVAGKGIEILRNHGIKVTEHILEEECESLNEVFFHYVKTKTPFVVMKYAMTMDGKIAAYTGESKWITGEMARTYVQKQRNRYRGIMAGIGTVLADDPMLTCRIENGRNPVRIVCDSHLRMPLSSKIVQTADIVPTIIATCIQDETMHIPYQKSGCKVLVLPQREGHVDLQSLMQRLGQEEIDSILLEGGAALNWSALQSNVVQKVQCYIAPKLLGGAQAKSPIGGIGAAHPDEAVKLKNSHVIPLDEDFLIESEVCSDVYRNS